MTSALIFDVYQIVPPGDSITFLATLTDAYGKSYRPELNGTGAGQFTIARTSPHATAAIMAPGNLVKVRTAVQVDPIGSFFLETGDFTLISSNEEGGEDLRFGGRGGLGYWDRAIWLSEVFTQPWWPDCITTPAAGARGAVVVQAGTYRAYSVSGTPKRITGFVDFRTPAFCATFDTRQTYSWPGANPDGSANKRFLVHLLDGDHAGIYFHPKQPGVEEFLASGGKQGTIKSSIPLLQFGASPGAVLKFMYDEGVSADRPAHPIPLMTVDFTDTLDSDGNAWTTTDALAGLTASPGDNYLATIGTLLGTGVIDVVMGPDLDMHAYNHYGRDLSGSFGVGKVRFQRAVNIVDALQFQIADRVVGTYAQVAGSDDTYGSAELPDAASRIAREVSVSGDSTDPTVLEAIGLAELNLRLRRGESLTFPIAVGSNEATGRYTPGPPGSTGHVWIGDTITVDTGADEPDFDATDARLIAVVLGESDAGELTATVDVRTGPLADVGSLASLSTPDALTFGDKVGECGCPPFNAPDNLDFNGHYYSGTIYKLTPIHGADSFVDAISDAVFLPATTYHWGMTVTEETVGGTSSSGVFKVIDEATGNPFSGSGQPTTFTGVGTFTGSFTIGGTGGRMLAQLSVLHNDVRDADATVTFFVDPDGWVATTNAPLPQYGQRVLNDRTVEAVDGATRTFTMALGQVTGYKPHTLAVQVDGHPVVAGLTELPTTGQFILDFAPKPAEGDTRAEAITFQYDAGQGATGGAIPGAVTGLVGFGARTSEVAA